jgi:PAS domain S-box-containing protein
MEAMDLAHLANWELDHKTGMFTFDDRFYALYGTTAEREGGYQMPADVYFREFVHPDDRGRINEEHERCREISDPDYISQQEHRIIRRDGGIRYISVRSERTTDNDGNIIKICGVNQDITERRIAEEKLCRSEEKLSAIVDYLPHATFVVDASGTVIAWNRAMEDLTGRKGEDIIGRGNFEHGFVLYGKRAPTLIDFVIHPDREIPEKYHIVKQEKNKLVARTYSRYLKPDGQTLLGFAVPLYDSNGNLVGAIESMRDVSGTELPRKVSSIDNP